jgi:hypothetical protein
MRAVSISEFAGVPLPGHYMTTAGAPTEGVLFVGSADFECCTLRRAKWNTNCCPFAFMFLFYCICVSFTYLHLVTRLKVSGAVPPPLTHTPLWRAQGPHFVLLDFLFALNFRTPLSSFKFVVPLSIRANHRTAYVSLMSVGKPEDKKPSMVHRHMGEIFWETGCESARWSQLAQNSAEERAVLNTVIILWVPSATGTLLDQLDYYQLLHAVSIPYLEICGLLGYYAA